MKQLLGYLVVIYMYCIQHVRTERERERDGPSANKRINSIPDKLLALPQAPLMSNGLELVEIYILSFLHIVEIWR